MSCTIASLEKPYFYLNELIITPCLSNTIIKIIKIIKKYDRKLDMKLIYDDENEKIKRPSQIDDLKKIIVMDNIFETYMIDNEWFKIFFKMRQKAKNQCVLIFRGGTFLNNNLEQWINNNEIFEEILLKKKMRKKLKITLIFDIMGSISRIPPVIRNNNKIHMFNNIDILRHYFAMASTKKSQKTVNKFNNFIERITNFNIMNKKLLSKNIVHIKYVSENLFKDYITYLVIPEKIKIENEKTRYKKINMFNLMDELRENCQYHEMIKYIKTNDILLYPEEVKEYMEILKYEKYHSFVYLHLYFLRNYSSIYDKNLIYIIYDYYSLI
mgnify:CR=1 FL=1